MIRTAKKNGKLANHIEQIVGVTLSRAMLSRRMGAQYGGKRRVYEALGYPDEKELTYEYFLGKYERQDIATAIIDRPANASWNSLQAISEEDVSLNDSVFKDEWKKLDERLKVVYNLNRLDKLMGIGCYAVLLFGFSDVKERRDWEKPLQQGGNLQLMYLKPVSEENADITQWETRPDNERYGMPLFYSIAVGKPGVEGFSESIKVHHSRVMHVSYDGLESEIYGRPRLKPIVNRLLDIEKLLGGDAEMFWRGARPGYSASNKDDYELDDEDMDALEKELDKYENDLRRFIMAQGVDINALQQQVADPLNHLDAQLQAISAQTGIPKRVLIGSERGELSSSQDQDQWLGLLRSRMEDFNEPVLLRPFINKCMQTGIITEHENYNVVWEDIFALSEKEKAEVGRIRSESLSKYVSSLGGMDVLPPESAYKYLLGLDEEQAQEIFDQVDLQALEEDREMERADEEAEEEEEEIEETTEVEQ